MFTLYLNGKLTGQPVSSEDLSFLPSLPKSPTVHALGVQGDAVCDSVQSALRQNVGEVVCERSERQATAVSIDSGRPTDIDSLKSPLPYILSQICDSNMDAL